MKTIAIIQARLGSTRLPFKMMLSLHGMPIIEWVVKRVQQATLLDDIIVAIPISEENDILAAYLHKLGVKTFRGDESDVLKRFYDAAKNENASSIVRICADNPLIDASEIDNLIKYYKKYPCDYAYNHIPRNNRYPDGIGAEIIPFSLLEKLHETVTSQHHKEHCLSYIYDNHAQFVIRTFDPPDPLLHHPEMRFDIDTFDDYYRLATRPIYLEISSNNLIQIFKESK
jgi:spore coat polysaccharide biosynthesis protein SpsF